MIVAFPPSSTIWEEELLPIFKFCASSVLLAILIISPSPATFNIVALLLTKLNTLLVVLISPPFTLISSSINKLPVILPSPTTTKFLSRSVEALVLMVVLIPNLPPSL